VGTAEELDAGGLHDHFEMYASPRWWKWFSLRFWRFRTPVQSDYEKRANELSHPIRFAYLPRLLSISFNKDARAAQQAVEDLLSDLLNGALKNPATYLSSNPCQ